MLNATDERGRLLQGPAPDERPEGFVITYEARCNAAASEVLERIREVMAILLEYQEGNWPDDDVWPEVLPAWLVGSFAPRAAAATWSLISWVWWFEPTERAWFWWDGRTVDDETVQVRVVVDGDPAPTGALELLLRAAGATDVVDDRY